MVMRLRRRYDIPGTRAKLVTYPTYAPGRRKCCAHAQRATGTYDGNGKCVDPSPTDKNGVVTSYARRERNQVYLQTDPIGHRLRPSRARTHTITTAGGRKKQVDRPGQPLDECGTRPVFNRMTAIRRQDVLVGAVCWKPFTNEATASDGLGHSGVDQPRRSSRPKRRTGRRSACSQEVPARRLEDGTTATTSLRLQPARQADNGPRGPSGRVTKNTYDEWYLPDLERA